MALRAIREDVDYEEKVVVYPQKQIVKNRFKNRQTINTTLRNRIFTLAFIALFGGVCLTFLNTYIGVRGYDVSKMRQEALEIEQYNERMKVDIAHLKSPKRIQDIAIHQLGMIVPQEVYFATSKK